MFTSYRILIFSEDPDKLMQFYQNILGLKLIQEYKLSNDYGYMFEITHDLLLWIAKHSEVKGKAKENFRHIFNVYPEEGVHFWYEKIKNNPEVSIIANPFLSPISTPTDEKWCCTFLDPEGNCWQFAGKK